MSNIVLNTLTYVGEGIASGIARFVERSQGVYAGFRSLVGRMKSSRDKVEVVWTLALPVIADADSPCACDGDVLQMTYVNVSVRFDKKASPTHRLDVYNQLKDLVNNTTVFQPSVVDLTILP